MANHTITEPAREQLPQDRVRPALGATAVGAAAFGAVALGALVIARLAIGALFVSRARFRRVEVDDLVVKRLHYKD